MKTILLLLIFSYLFTLKANGQSEKIDSLEILLNKHVKADTAKVNLINALAYELYNRDPKKAKTYADEAFKLASPLNYHKGKAVSLWITGLTTLRNDCKKSLEYFRKALKIAEIIGDKPGMSTYLIAIGNVTKSLGDIEACKKAYEQALQIALQLNDKQLIIKSRINISRDLIREGNHVEAARQLQELIKMTEEIGDEVLLARTYSNLAFIYSVQNDPSMALEYFLASLKINEKRNDYKGTFFCLISIAEIQSRQNDFSAAFKTIQKALKLAEAKGDSIQMSICFTNLGNLYQSKNPSKALDYFQKAQVRVKDYSQAIDNLTSMGTIYTDRKDFENAKKNFDKALALAQKADSKRFLSEVYLKIGGMYIKQGNYSQAIDYTQRTLDMAKAAEYLELQKEGFRQLASIYATTGNFKEAYLNHTEYKLLEDSIFNKQNVRKIALLESSYRFAKEREVYELEKSRNEIEISSQRQIILSLIVIAILFILLASAVYWSSRLKKKVLRLEIEKVNQELEANQKAMAVAKLKLVQNSERNAHNVKILEDVEKDVAGEEQARVRMLINEYKSQSVHSNWDEFETLFTKVNGSFLGKLNELYPTLTLNERKLCVFLKLNMSNKDIAQITLQTEEALKKSRLRLRKKLELDRSINLSTFIQNF